MTFGTGVLAAGQLTIGLAPDQIWAAIGMVIGLFGVSLFTVVGRTLRQALTPDRLLGRVVASFRLIGIGSLPIGALFGGWLARLAGLRMPYFVSAAVISIAAVVIFRVSTEERIGSFP